MTGRPSDPARVWLNPAAPELIADAVRRGGGAIVPVEEANAIVWYGSPPADPADLRALQSGSIAWVQVMQAGVEEWFARGLIDRERLWTSAVGAYVVAVAEHIVALLLASAKRLPECARAETWRKPELEGGAFAGSTVGIVGAGSIGGETIRRLAPFGVRVLASTRSGVDVPGAARSLGAGDLDELLAESDYVVLCAPLTPQTRGLIGARELDLLGPGGVLVNVARGGVVDTDALVVALRDGRIRGALLDVTEPEPLPDGHPLWSEPRALITPHIANTRAQLDAALARRVEENVARFAAGERPVGAIDPAAGY